jgi:hypothetical protein
MKNVFIKVLKKGFYKRFYKRIKEKRKRRTYKEINYIVE